MSQKSEISAAIKQQGWPGDVSADPKQAHFVGQREAVVVPQYSYTGPSTAMSWTRSKQTTQGRNDPVTTGIERSQPADTSH